MNSSSRFIPTDNFIMSLNPVEVMHTIEEEIDDSDDEEVYSDNLLARELNHDIRQDIGRTLMNVKIKGIDYRVYKTRKGIFAQDKLGKYNPFELGKEKSDIPGGLEILASISKKEYNA